MGPTWELVHVTSAFDDGRARCQLIDPFLGPSAMSELVFFKLRSVVATVSRGAVRAAQRPKIIPPPITAFILGLPRSRITLLSFFLLHIQIIQIHRDDPGRGI